MNKKGLSYVDWAISLVIFIIFTITIFVVIKPHVIEDHSAEYLVSIAEQGIKDINQDHYYEIDKYPLFLKYVGEDSVGRWVSYQSDVISSFGPLGFLSVSNPLTSENLEFELSSDVLSIDTGISSFDPNEVYEFSILYSGVDLGGLEGSSTNSFLCSREELECVLGVVEKLEGFNVDNLYDLFGCEQPNVGCCDSTDEYGSFKDSINYPSVRDLSVRITGDNVDTICQFVFPEESDNVYVLSWNDDILNSDGTKTPVLVEVGVW